MLKLQWEQILKNILQTWRMPMLTTYLVETRPEGKVMLNAVEKKILKVGSTNTGNETASNSTIKFSCQIIFDN